MNFRENRPTDRRKVVMVVYNDFTNDARVLKEAQSLEKTGCSVLVVAFWGPGLPAIEKLSEHIAVRRIGRSIPLISAIYKLVCFQLAYPTLQKISRSAAKAAHFLFKIPEYFFIILRTIWQVWRSDSHIVHSHDLNTLLPCWLVAKLKSLPIVYDAHEISFDREGYSQFKLILKPLEAFLIRRVDRVITTTDMRADILRQEYDIALPAVLQNRPRECELIESDALRDRFKLDQSRPIVLYQGGISQGRGMRNLVKVALRTPELYFVCIGSGKQESELDRLITQNKLEDRFFRIPKVHLSELHALTCSATVGIQPLRNTCLNHYSTDSNKLFEYVMAGLPVAASDFPEIRKIITTHKIGVLFNPDDPESISKALTSLVASDVYQATRKRVIAARQHLTWESQEKVLQEDVYGSLMGTGSQLEEGAYNNAKV